MSRVQTIEVDRDSDGMRLDRWFRARFPHITQGRIEKLCRKGDIRVDSGRVKPATRLEEGQSVRVPPLPDAQDDRPAPGRKALTLSDEDIRALQDLVIYKDADIIALNKPAGLPVQGGSGQTRHIDGMAAALQFDAPQPPKLVHRLDKDTSGILIMARNGRAAAGLAKAFQSHDTRKIYWAAVAGVPHPRAGTIRYGLVKAPGHGPHGAGEKMICIHPDAVKGTEGAKRATTDYVVIEALASRAAWVALSPITGRTHQLRAHIAEIGNPIVGDGKYGTNRQTNEGDGWGAQLGGDISRKLHLHARSLSFTHPTKGRRMTLVADLPDHMKRTWDTFGWNPADAAGDPFEDLA
ncbi:RluA family pseudouridine synthase [Oceanomicrobium pacificus]|uniref:Pseudouridine synthase n=1 Tax=Oceanomicrobium pacificus TaxID=2692916 RepID=A0A6B0U6B9_9RHOB|nr:RluA family pseudouridine synthase [Oceanomicrobium pacificus]MXU66411.1 RluA family pseudouridine synthase [Oceanomicrobium pacificus]